MGERTLVVVVVAVHLTLGAESLGSLQALLALRARVVLVSPSNAVADLEVLGVGTDFLDDTDTLVSEDHVGLAVVLISTAKTGGGDTEVALVSSELRLGGGGLFD